MSRAKQVRPLLITPLLLLLVPLASGFIGPGFVPAASNSRYQHVQTYEESSSPTFVTATAPPRAKDSKLGVSVGFFTDNKDGGWFNGFFSREKKQPKQALSSEDANRVVGTKGANSAANAFSQVNGHGDDVIPVQKMDWSAMTVADLKAELKSQGLPVSGKKADLVARLEAHSITSEPAQTASSSQPTTSFWNFNLFRESEKWFNNMQSKVVETTKEPIEKVRDAESWLEKMQTMAIENPKATVFDANNEKVALALEKFEEELTNQWLEASDKIAEEIGNNEKIRAASLKSKSYAYGLETLSTNLFANSIKLQAEEVRASNDEMNKLIQDGKLSREHVIPTPKQENDWSAYSVASLKSELKSKGLPVSGKKSDLIARLEAHEMQAQISDIMDNVKKVMSGEFSSNIDWSEWLPVAFDSKSRLFDHHEDSNLSVVLPFQSAGAKPVWNENFLGKTKTHVNGLFAKWIPKYPTFDTEEERTQLMKDSYAAMEAADATIGIGRKETTDAPNVESVQQATAVDVKPKRKTTRATKKAVGVDSKKVDIKDWSTLTVKQLKAELKSRGLDVKGKKADMVARLSAAAAPQSSSTKVKKSLFEEESLDPSLKALEEKAQDFSELTVVNLRSKLRSKGLRVSGTKRELVERLRAA